MIKYIIKYGEVEEAWHFDSIEEFIDYHEYKSYLQRLENEKQQEKKSEKKPTVQH